MRKFLLIAVILSLLIPASLFAKGPTDAEVTETTIAVLSLFGMVFMSSMFGTSPEGVEINMDMETGKSAVVFDSFEVEPFVLSMADMMSQVPEGEKPVFSFEMISGDIDVNEAGDLLLDVNLKGGNIKTLKIESSGEDLVSLEANGKDFSHLDSVFEDME